MIAHSKPNVITKKRRKSGHYEGTRPKVKRPLLESSRLYPLREAALACGCSISTMIRARDAGHLSELRTGAKVQFAGAALLRWLEAGGKTGQGRKGDDRETPNAN